LRRGIFASLLLLGACQKNAPDASPTAAGSTVPIGAPGALGAHAATLESTADLSEPTTSEPPPEQAPDDSIEPNLTGPVDSGVAL
jgi:hypothetical protein